VGPLRNPPKTPLKDGRDRTLASGPGGVVRHRSDRGSAKASSVSGSINPPLGDARKRLLKVAGWVR
jgi:hypothetical protein